MAYVGRSDCYDGPIEAVSETLQEAQWTADVIAELTNKYQLTISEVVDMAGLAIEIIDQECEEFERDHAAARLDAERLSAPGVPIEEVLEIFVRNHERLMRMAEVEPDPGRRRRIVDFLAASEASLRGTYERAQERAIAKHRGLNG